jgi:phosphate-selective porin
MAAGMLAAGCLLLPTSLWAQGEAGGSGAGAAARAAGSLEERVEALEQAKTAYEEAAREQERLEQRLEELERAIGSTSPSGAPGPAAAPPAPDDEVDRRIRTLEREIAALKQGRSENATGAPSGREPAAQQEAAAQPQEATALTTAGTAAAATSSPQAAPSPPAEKPLLVWNVTPDITFKPGLRLQTRYTHDGASNNNDIAIQRFRLKGAGDAWKAKYYLELKIDNTGTTGRNPSAAVENAWLDYALVPDVVTRAGLYDVPFSRDALTSDSKLLFMDRSLIKDALTAFGLADNGIGVMARGRPLEGHFEYAVGAFNNDRFDGLGTSGRATGWVMPAVRVAVDLLDPAPPGGYADYRGSYVGKGRRLSIGTNAEWLGDAQSGPQEFDLYALGTDLFFNLGPYTLQAEYDWFRLTGNVDTSNHGWYVQGGYLLEPLNERLAEVAPWFPDLELAARYQDLDAKSFSPERERRTSLGLNAYIHDHNLKVQTDFSWRQLEDSSDNKLYQLQLQLDF